MSNIQDYDAAKTAVESGKQELIPAEVVFAILDGANPINVWREARGLTQQQLANATGISKPYLSQIETGKRKGSTEKLVAIANASHISLEDIDLHTPNAKTAQAIEGALAGCDLHHAKDADAMFTKLK
jgi:transcriptional regulator with XRE-family HTH domain